MTPFWKTSEGLAIFTGVLNASFSIGFISNFTVVYMLRQKGTTLFMQSEGALTMNLFMDKVSW